MTTINLSRPSSKPAVDPGERESMPCPLCGLHTTAADEPFLRGQDRLHDLPGEFTVVRCRRCRLLRTDPRPTPEAMAFYYPSDYGPYQSTRVPAAPAAPPAAPHRSWWKRAARAVFQFNIDRLPEIEPGRLLEIGCASGSFLRRMAARGWDAEGIEFSPEAAAAARDLGFTVHAGSVEGAPDPEAPYDLVVGWMVLEHLHDPVLALRKLHRWTRPGGWLALSVPNAGAAEFRLFRDAWFALQVPTHLFHYTPDTAAALLERGGWRTERVLHQRILSNWIGSVGIVLKRHPATERLGKKLLGFTGRPTPLHFLLYPLAYLLSLGGQTGRMTLWARRIDG
jgi:2-polyprenyl-3-methyl-5-hydroxy-6-metoxy-1,4-benzoquinol methylase